MTEWLTHRALELLREYRQNERALLRARILQDYARERESLRWRRELMPGVDRECITHHICDCRAARMAELEQEIARLRLDLAAEREKREQAERERDELRRIVDAETPIAAFDLATTWQAERAMLQEQLAETERERDAALARVAVLRKALRTLFDLLEEHGPPWYLNQHYKQAHAALDQARQGGDDA